MNREKSETLSKSERLSSKILIDQLFGHANDTIVMFPFRVIYMPIANSDSPVRIVISIPKKRFHNAVERNRMKRMVREAYRRQKQPLMALTKEKGLSMAVAFICITSNMCTYKSIYGSVGKAIGRISTELNGVSVQNK